MRQGGRRFHVQAPWRQRRNPSQSSIHSNTYGYKLLCAIIAFAITFLIIVWNLQRKISINDQQLENRRLVFPLYEHRIRLPNGTQNKLWGNTRRRLRSIPPPLFEMGLKFTIEMKLGVNARPYVFQVDTGSRNMWVLCKAPGKHIQHKGPNGLFEPRPHKKIKCDGKHYTVCQMLQMYDSNFPCDPAFAYNCLAGFRYADESEYTGFYVKERIVLPVRDQRGRIHEVNGDGYFGCVTQKWCDGEELPVEYDGILGMGNCPFSLVEQWAYTKYISHHIIAICIAKAEQLNAFQKYIPFTNKKQEMGYVSIGDDLKDKFDNFNWAKMLRTPNFKCGVIVDVLYIQFENFKFLSPSSIISKTTGTPLLIDTGTTMTYLDDDAYNPLMSTFHSYMGKKGYTEVLADLEYIEHDRRRCYTTYKGVAEVPIDQFPNITFAIEGKLDPVENMHFITIQAKNYLSWDEQKKLLCLDILWEEAKGRSTLGSAQMRETLFVIDFDNQRIRWKQDSCAL